MANDLQFNLTNADDIYTQIIKSLETYIKEPLYPGDERRIFGEALTFVFVSIYNQMNDTAKQKMLKYARGTVLDALGERTDTPRLPSSKASTVIRFSLSGALLQNTVIPKGTKTTSDGVLYFQTTEAKIILPGDLSIDIPSESLEGGNKYNGLLPGTVSTLVDLIPFINEVKNIDTTHSGDDGEPYTIEGDDSYRDRIRLSPSKFSTAGPYGAYEYHALSADPDIVSISVLSPSPGVIKIIPLLINGGIPTDEIIEKVLNICNDSKIRPLTDYVIVEKPEVVEYDIEIKYYTTPENEDSVIQAIEDDNGAVEQYIKWQSAELGRSINPDKLRNFILNAGAARINVITPQFTAIDKIQIAKSSGSIAISHEVVKE